jgi:hypothetical protein
MSVIKYIDIDSTYRNTLMYPLPGNFVLNINAKSTDSITAAADPISLAFPFETGQLLSVAAGPPVLYGLSADSSSVNNYYKNNYIEIAGAFQKIISYDGSTKKVTVSASIGGSVNDTYTIRKELPYALMGAGPAGTPQDFQDTTNVASPSFDKVFLGAAATVKSGEYTNKYLYFPGTSVAGSLTSPTGYIWRRISNYYYTGAGAAARKVAVVYPPLPVITPINTVYEILNFSYDNNKSLIFNGTTIMNNAVCEKVKLINLIVPVVPIEGSLGGTILDYPFLYVALYSEKGKTWANPLEGNNPTSKQALFKVPITFNSNYSDKWITLQGSLMDQYISFKENDQLHCTVYLPDGTILDFANTTPYFYFPDFSFPVLPDPGKQIQAVFEVTRLEDCRM